MQTTSGLACTGGRSRRSPWARSSSRCPATSKTRSCRWALPARRRASISAMTSAIDTRSVSSCAVGATLSLRSVVHATEARSTARAAAPPTLDVSPSLRAGGGIGEALRVAKHTESRSVAAAVVSEAPRLSRDTTDADSVGDQTSQVDVPTVSVESRGRAARCIDVTPKPCGVPKIAGGPLQCHRCTGTTHFVAHGGWEPRWSTRDRGSTRPRLDRQITTDNVGR